MLENNNLKICRRLALREFRFHKVRNTLLVSAVALVCALFYFVLLIGNAVEQAYLTSYEWRYGSSNHITFYGLTQQEAEQISGNPAVKETVALRRLGEAGDKALEYRGVHVAAANQAYARNVQAIPEYGRMPREKDEIAMDTLTLDSLGVEARLGAAIVLQWKESGSQESRTDEFTLCGYWEGAEYHQEDYAWVSIPYADEQAVRENWFLGVLLYRPQILEEQAVQLLQEEGLRDISYTVNYAYHKNGLKYAFQQAAPYYIITLLVIVCGCLMIYSIMRIAVHQNLHFYIQVKTLGVTPRQVSRIIFGQAGLLCILGIPFGWCIGFLLHMLIVPYIVVGIENPVFYFLEFWPFAASALLTWVITMTACYLPVRSLGAMLPAEASVLVQPVYSERKRGRRIYRRSTVPGLAWNFVRSHCGRGILAVMSLLLALLMVCSIWIKYHSYDEQLYLEQVMMSDIVVADRMAVASYQRYDPRHHGIDEAWIGQLEARDEVLEIGSIRTVEEVMQADEQLLEAVSDFYNSTGRLGIPRRDEMEGDPGWTDALERLEQEKEYTALVVGVSGLTQQLVCNETLVIDGAYDEDLWESGEYVIAKGAIDATEVSAMPAGGKVRIRGKEFTVMMQIPGLSGFPLGNNSQDSTLGLGYYLPEHVFEELYPDAGIRQVMINIDIDRQEQFEAYLTAAFEHEKDIAYILRSDYQRRFRSGRMSSLAAEIIVGGVLLLIGLLNFTNVLVTGTVVRQRELAVYQSLGMTRGQITRMILMEGLFYAAMTAGILIPFVTGAMWWGLPALFGASDESWIMSYHFSLTPLWLTLLAAVLLAALVPLACMLFGDRRSVTESLRSE